MRTMLKKQIPAVLCVKVRPVTVEVVATELIEHQDNH
jgi:hypothetical protein